MEEHLLYFYLLYGHFVLSFKPKKINSMRISPIGDYTYKRASLACAARLADTLCPPEAPFGRLEVTLVNYSGDIISKYVHLSFKSISLEKTPNLSIF